MNKRYDTLPHLTIHYTRQPAHTKPPPPPPQAARNAPNMAHQLRPELYSVFGWIVWGDLGPVTIYRDHQGKMVAYAKTWPKDPASAKQLVQRQRFTAGAGAGQG